MKLAPQTLAAGALALLSLAPALAAGESDSQAAPAAAAPAATAAQEKIVTTASGLKYEDLKVGEGAEAKSGDRVEVHYTGWLENGTKFDCSVDRGKPVRLPARRRPGHQGLGRGRRRHEGGRQAQADHPARARLRRRGAPAASSRPTPR